MVTESSKVSQIPAIVFGCLNRGELRIVVYPGIGLADGGYDWDVPINDIPIELRMPNTLLWLQVDEHRIVRVWRREPTTTSGIPIKRRASFSLRRLLLIITLLACWIAWGTWAIRNARWGLDLVVFVLLSFFIVAILGGALVTWLATARKR